MNGGMNVIRTIVEHRELIYNLVSRDLKSRYKGSMLGFLWTVLTPLFMAVVYIFFLRMLAGRGVPNEEIIIGVFAWTFTMQCVNGGMMSIAGNANLVKKVTFPRIILPFSTVVASLVNYLLSLVVQFALVGGLLLVHGQTMGVWLLAIPLIILFHTLFNLAIALLLSATNVYFRDTQHLVGVLTSAWFFMTPVMYNLSFVNQVAAAKPKLTITAESPLRADSADGSTGSLEASLINTPAGTPPSIFTGGFMPSTGDMAMYAAAAAAVAGAALIVVALLVKRGGGSSKE